MVEPQSDWVTGLQVITRSGGHGQDISHNSKYCSVAKSMMIIAMLASHDHAIFSRLSTSAGKTEESENHLTTCGHLTLTGLKSQPG